MKIMYASTPEQEKKVRQLVEYFYTVIFPKYFTDREISMFIDLNVLNMLNLNELQGTLKEAYQIISSLNTLCFLIESDSLAAEKGSRLFEKNAKILNDLGMSFPFSRDQFLREGNVSLESGSIYVKPANDWLV